MRVTSKGQVTIPKAIRDEGGISPGTEVEFEIDDGVITVRPSRSRGEELVEHLRRHREDFELTTDEIMAMTRGED